MTSRSVLAVAALGALADVVRNEPLERLELLEELLRWDLAFGLAAAEHPRRGLDRGVPRDLVGVGAPALLLAAVAGRLRDPVEVDVLEAVALLLVEGDAG